MSYGSANQARSRKAKWACKPSNHTVGGDLTVFFPPSPAQAATYARPYLLDSSIVPHPSVLPFVDSHGSLPRAGGTRETHLSPLLSAACALFAGKRMKEYPSGRRSFFSRVERR